MDAKIRGVYDEVKRDLSGSDPASVLRGDGLDPEAIESLSTQEWPSSLSLYLGHEFARSSGQSVEDLYEDVQAKLDAGKTPTEIMKDASIDVAGAEEFDNEEIDDSIAFLVGFRAAKVPA